MNYGFTLLNVDIVNGYEQNYVDQALWEFSNIYGLSHLTCLCKIFEFLKNTIEYVVRFQKRNEDHQTNYKFKISLYYPESTE